MVLLMGYLFSCKYCCILHSRRFPSKNSNLGDIADSGSLYFKFTTSQNSIRVNFNKAFSKAPKMSQIFVETESANNTKELTFKPWKIDTTGFDIMLYSHTLSRDETLHWIVLKEPQW